MSVLKTCVKKTCKSMYVYIYIEYSRADISLKFQERKKERKKESKKERKKER